MAGFYLQLNGSVTVAAGVTRTLYQIIAPSDQKLRICGVEFSSKGAASGDKSILCSIVRQTGAGTSSSATIQKRNEMDTETIRSSALGTFSSTEPTTDKTYWSRYMPCMSGQLVYNPFANNPNGLIINEGERVAFTVTVDAGVSGSPEIDISILFEE